MLARGWITADEANALRDKLTTLLRKNDIAPFFKEGLKVKSEADILLKNGDVVRPDRLILEGRKVKIIDFKSGHRADSHVKQIEKYEKALLNMGFQSVEKYLLYTEEESILMV